METGARRDGNFVFMHSKLAIPKILTLWNTCWNSTVDKQDQKKPKKKQKTGYNIND